MLVPWSPEQLVSNRGTVMELTRTTISPTYEAITDDVTHTLKPQIGPYTFATWKDAGLVLVQHDGCWCAPMVTVGPSYALLKVFDLGDSSAPIRQHTLVRGHLGMLSAYFGTRNYIHSVQRKGTLDTEHDRPLLAARAREDLREMDKTIRNDFKVPLTLPQMFLYFDAGTWKSPDAVLSSMALQQWFWHMALVRRDGVLARADSAQVVTLAFTEMLDDADIGAMESRAWSDGLDTPTMLSQGLAPNDGYGGRLTGASFVWASKECWLDEHTVPAHIVPDGTYKNLRLDTRKIDGKSYNPLGGMHGKSPGVSSMASVLGTVSHEWALLLAASHMPQGRQDPKVSDLTERMFGCWPTLTADVGRALADTIMEFVPQRQTRGGGPKTLHPVTYPNGNTDSYIGTLDMYSAWPFAYPAMNIVPDAVASTHAIDSQDAHVIVGEFKTKWRHDASKVDQDAPDLRQHWRQALFESAGVYLNNQNARAVMDERDCKTVLSIVCVPPTEKLVTDLHVYTKQRDVSADDLKKVAVSVCARQLLCNPKSPPGACFMTCRFLMVLPQGLRYTETSKNSKASSWNVVAIAANPNKTPVDDTYEWSKAVEKAMCRTECLHWPDGRPDATPNNTTLIYKIVPKMWDCDESVHSPVLALKNHKQHMFAGQLLNTNAPPSLRLPILATLTSDAENNTMKWSSRIFQNDALYSLVVKADLCLWHTKVYADATIATAFEDIFRTKTALAIPENSKVYYRTAVQTKCVVNNFENVVVTTRTYHEGSISKYSESDETLNFHDAMRSVRPSLLRTNLQDLNGKIPSDDYQKSYEDNMASLNNAKDRFVVRATDTVLDYPIICKRRTKKPNFTVKREKYWFCYGDYSHFKDTEWVTDRENIFVPQDLIWRTFENEPENIVHLVTMLLDLFDVPKSGQLLDIAKFKTNFLDKINFSNKTIKKAVNDGIVKVLMHMCAPHEIQNSTLTKGQLMVTLEGFSRAIPLSQCTKVEQLYTFQPGDYVATLKNERGSQTIAQLLNTEQPAVLPVGRPVRFRESHPPTCALQVTVKPNQTYMWEFTTEAAVELHLGSSLPLPATIISVSDAVQRRPVHCTTWCHAASLSIQYKVRGKAESVRIGSLHSKLKILAPGQVVYIQAFVPPAELHTGDQLNTFKGLRNLGLVYNSIGR